MLLKYAEVLAIVVHENMKLGDNWLEDVSFKHVIIDQKLAFRIQEDIILLPSNINVLETQKWLETIVNLKFQKIFWANSKFLASLLK